MDLQVLAAGAQVAGLARLASHLTGRQIVPGLAIVTVLLLTLVILFGPAGPLSRPRRLTRLSRTADRTIHVTEPGDSAKDVAGDVPGEQARST